MTTRAARAYLSFLSFFGKGHLQLRVAGTHLCGFSKIRYKTVNLTGFIDGFTCKWNPKEAINDDLEDFVASCSQIPFCKVTRETTQFFKTKKEREA